MFINTGKYYLNASEVLYIVESQNGALINTADNTHYISLDNYNSMKSGLKGIEDLFEVVGFGFVNLKNMRFVDYNPDTISYRIKYLYGMEITLSSDKIKGLDDALFNKIKEGSLGKDDKEDMGIPEEKEETSLTAEPASIADLQVGSDTQIIVTTDAAVISAEINKQNIATISVSDKTITVNGVDQGDAVITIRATADGKTEKVITVNVKVIEAA